MRDQMRRGLVAAAQVGRAIVLLIGLVGINAVGEQTGGQLSSGPREAESFELAPGIVVDGRLPLLYLMAPGGGIEAIDRRSGEPIWSSELAARPLLVVGGRLMAQVETAGSTGALSLTFLNARKGGVCNLRAEVPIPKDVLPIVDQRLGASFTVRAWVEDEDVVVAWHYLEKDVTGVAPPPGAPPFRQQQSGASRIDVSTGHVTALTGTAEPAPRPLPKPVQRLFEAGDLRMPPWRAGNILATSVERDDEGGGRRVVLWRWHPETGESLPEVVLLDEPAVARVPSGDRKHLMVVSMLPVRGAGGERYLWSVFSLATGEKIGETRQPGSAPPFCVLDGLMLYQSLPFGRRVDGEWVEEPMKVRTIDLETGFERWSRPVRDTAFRGPPPPGR